VRLLGLQAAFPYLVEAQDDAPARRRPSSAWYRASHRTVTIFQDGTRVDQRRIPRRSNPGTTKNYRMPGAGLGPKGLADAFHCAGDGGGEDTRRLPAPRRSWRRWSRRPAWISTTALRIESRYLAKLARWERGEKPDFALFNRNAIKSGASRPKDVPNGKRPKVGILAPA